jgi:hypothetical protein
MPQWSKQRAPQADSILSLVAGTDPPGSPATMSARTGERARSIPSAPATSAMRRA